MRGRKKLSPFETLMRFIEELQLEQQYTMYKGHLDLNHDFFLGFTSAVNAIYAEGVAIYNRGLKASEFIGLDLSDPESLEKLKKMWS